jgi:hypothetical protein
MAVKTEEKTEEQRRAERQAVEHRESVAAIEAAEAILLPLGFIRRKDDKAYFNFKEPGRVEAEWHLKDPEIDAHISRQSKPWNRDSAVAGGDGSYDYRLVVRARKVWSLRDARIAPGNRPGLLAHIEKVKEALATSAAYDRKLERLLKDAKSLITHEFPNLKITHIEAEHDDLVTVRVQTKTGGQFYISLSGSLNFMGLTVTEDGTGSRPIGRSLKRALGAL